jgi:mannose-6-phosphate isomerase
MSEILYPLKFKPILKERIWGGHSLVKDFRKVGKISAKYGESWEISGIETDISIVNNGFLKGNSLTEIIEIYMGDLIGDKVFEQYGMQFPLLFKLIDASETLSIQVHPGDDIAFERHNSLGKTEMWYIMKSGKEAQLINGFKKDTDVKSYVEALNNGKLDSILNFDNVVPGDVFFIPSGRVHGIGAGIVLAEIQQSSDVTYRIYDWGRVDDNGNPRELHTELALDVIDYSAAGKTKSEYEPTLNRTVNIVECPYFRANLIKIDITLDKDYNMLDSFVIFMCVEGAFQVKYQDGKIEKVGNGESIMIPAVLKNIQLIPDGKATLLEVYLQ